MEKRKKYLITFGIAVNLIFAIFFALFPIRYYTGWDTLHKINPDNWLATDEKLLHFAFYLTFPVAATLMIVSAILFWRLRK